MNSLLPCHSVCSPALRSTGRRPAPPRITLSPLTFSRKYCKMLSVTSCCTDESSVESATSTSSSTGNVFGVKKELTGIRPLMNVLPPPLRLTSSAAVLVGAIAAGYRLGFLFGGAHNLALGSAAALGAAGGAIVYFLNALAPEIAAVNVHNFLVRCDDPNKIEKQDIDRIARRHGVNKEDKAFNAELCDLYSRFIFHVLPPGNEELRGNEVDLILNFKNALGIDDPDAANMHLEVGRWIFRQRLETGDDDAIAEQRRAFQKLIYVSTIVFGDASSFLLPWKRVFKLTDSQVELAVRDNAQRLYASEIRSVGGDIENEQLVRLRQAQHRYQLSDELAEELLKQHIRLMAQANISAALGALKSGQKPGDVRPTVKELDKLLALNKKLAELRSHADAASSAIGIGSVSLADGGEKEMEDLKLLYRVYLLGSFSDGKMDAMKQAAMAELKNIFGLSEKEADSIMLDLTTMLYRKRLGQAIANGDLELEDDKAGFLRNLRNELCLDSHDTSAVHEEIYLQKLRHCVSDMDLCEEDAVELNHLQIMLCIPQETVDAAHSDICGRLFEKVVKNGIAIALGNEGYHSNVKISVSKAARDLRITKSKAMSAIDNAVRENFLSQVKQARGAENRAEAVRELKEMVSFNAQVVSEMVAEIEDEEEQAQINLKQDLSERERIDLYKTFFLHLLTGEGTETPPLSWAQLTSREDEIGYALLNQLAAILGLTVQETTQVHRNLGEQTFRQQAEKILAGTGRSSGAQMEQQLDELREQIGLPEEDAEKIIKSITTEKMAVSLETAINRGRVGIEEIRELKLADIDVKSIVSVDLRESVLRKTMDDVFSSGTGDELDEEEIYGKIPSELAISVEKSREIVCDIARRRLPNSLIQAVALLRQNDHRGVVNSLRGLLACDKVAPSPPLTWEVPHEVACVYAIYYRSDPLPHKLARLQHLLGLSDSMAASLREKHGKVMAFD